MKKKIVNANVDGEGATFGLPCSNSMEVTVRDGKNKLILTPSSIYPNPNNSPGPNREPSLLTSPSFTAFLQVSYPNSAQTPSAHLDNSCDISISLMAQNQQVSITHSLVDQPVDPPSFLNLYKSSLAGPILFP